MKNENFEICFGQNLTVTNKFTGEQVTLKGTFDGTTVTVESESGDFKLAFNQTDPDAVATALEAVLAYVKLEIPIPGSKPPCSA
jgi:hypothetical protein